MLEDYYSASAVMTVHRLANCEQTKLFPPSSWLAFRVALSSYCHYLQYLYQSFCYVWLFFFALASPLPFFRVISSVSDFAGVRSENLFGHKTWKRIRKRIPGAKTRLKFAGFRVGSETPNNFNSLDHKNRTNSKSNSMKEQAPV